ncbi:hypothetical protein OPV22_005930 [Ensete ventricosum]|uniref:Uncharacterized protein n=1 Tax=Ensete ventricosum TaxID=4639 RepID=A0AAV8RM41_ENSVE|nr:hypothetical protein OPV22_005930 [Ensete ventricosum]
MDYEQRAKVLQDHKSFGNSRGAISEFIVPHLLKLYGSRATARPFFFVNHESNRVVCEGKSFEGQGSDRERWRDCAYGSAVAAKIIIWRHGE